MRPGPPLDAGEISNDTEMPESAGMLLRDRHLRLALHFRELRRVVSGETEEATVH